MSYEHIENGHKIIFESIVDYHLCKADYYKYGTDNSFTFFVERHLYDNTKVTVERIEHINEPAYYLGYDLADIDTNSVGVENINFEFLENSIENNGGILASDMLASNDVWSFGSDSWVEGVTFHPCHYPNDESLPVKKEPEKKPKINKKKFSRFDILDIEE